MIVYVIIIWMFRGSRSRRSKMKTRMMVLEILKIKNLKSTILNKVQVLINPWAKDSRRSRSTNSHTIQYMILEPIQITKRFWHREISLYKKYLNNKNPV